MITKESTLKAANNTLFHDLPGIRDRLVIACDTAPQQIPEVVYCLSRISLAIHTPERDEATHDTRKLITEIMTSIPHGVEHLDLSDEARGAAFWVVADKFFDLLLLNGPLIPHDTLTHIILEVGSFVGRFNAATLDELQQASSRLVARFGMLRR